MDVVLWSSVGALLAALLVVDLLMLSRPAHEVSLREAAVWSLVWLLVGLGFAFVVWAWHGPHDAAGYTAGYLIERTLSADNVFVFALVFTYFAVPVASQGRLLFFGILGALALRAGFIVAGAALLGAFHWTQYAFGAFLIVTGFRMFRGRGEEVHPEQNRVLRFVRRAIPSTPEYQGGKLFVRRGGKFRATPVLVVLLAVAIIDVVFAVDSIPAIFAVTREPFIVFTSNAFAVLGLRPLYFLLLGMMGRFVHLNLALAAILSLVGVKMLLTDVVDVPVWASLLTIVAILSVSILTSKRATSAGDDTAVSPIDGNERREEIDERNDAQPTGATRARSDA